MHAWIYWVGSLLILVNGSNNFYRNRPSYKYFEFDEPNERRWIRIPQPRSTNIETEDVESGRHFRPETLSAISETLGAINTVGRYIINMTRGGEDSDLPEDVPSAIYTISKNVLGRNVTDTIKPLVSPLVSPLVRETYSTTYQKPQTTEESENYPRSCTTPDGANGYCDDLSDCPQLLLNLSNLRQSLCFKSIFVPGVCCPRPISHVVSVAKPITTPPTTTIRAIAKTSPTIPTPTVSSTPVAISLPIAGSIVDPEDCGQPESAKFRVVGGEESLPGRWPWMAAIFLHGNRRTEFWCGGALITARHVLTAAHCTKDSQQRPFAARQFSVRLGDIDLKREDEPSAPVTYKVTEVRAHDKFSRVGFYNDIAILVLDRLVRKSKYVIPLCLPPPQLRNEKFAGQRTTVVGWGTTYYGRFNFPGRYSKIIKF
ncbi:hypothetical protein RI129_011852 [Pyrocoelia pectoralis]|uniref:Uncharacterized protein n=1 Tax=Pyrocoelia pectoralis TaxID=417401 RepID=A0AAN7UXK1_9COLE